MDGFLASPVGWGIANLMRKTSIFQCIINVPTHRGWFQEDKTKVWCTCDETSTLYLSAKLGQHRSSCTCTAAIYIFMYVYIHTHTHCPSTTTEELDSWENSLLRAKKPMGGKTPLFFNPVSENYFCDFGIIHSASWGLSFHPVTAQALAFSSSERWRSNFGIMGNSNEVSSFTCS